MKTLRRLALKQGRIYWGGYGNIMEGGLEYTCWEWMGVEVWKGCKKHGMGRR